jgi:N-acetylglucosaminyl-diphospho-decaprenol L-rhamnosyltransferase
MVSPEISIIIVTHNTRDIVADCLRSLCRSVSKLDCEIILVDNASTDGTVESISKNFPIVKIESLDHNLGYGTGVNAGVRVASGEYLLILNPDTLVLPGNIEKLRDYLAQHSRIGIVGAALCHPDGRPQASHFRFPSLLSEFWNQFPEIKYYLHLGEFGHKIIRLFSKQNDSKNKDPFRAESISGAAFMARAQAFEEVHGFDEDFFLYHDERDLCHRLWQEGWEVWSIPNAQVIHFDAQFTRYKQSRFPQSPVLEYRLLSMDRLWRKHKSKFAHKFWQWQTRSQIRVRGFILGLTMPFRKSKLDTKMRLSQLHRVIQLLKDPEILGKNIDGGWATKKS